MEPRLKLSSEKRCNFIPIIPMFIMGSPFEWEDRLAETRHASLHSACNNSFPKCIVSLLNMVLKAKAIEQNNQFYAFSRHAIRSASEGVTLIYSPSSSHWAQVSKFIDQPQFNIISFGQVFCSQSCFCAKNRFQAL